MENLNDKIAALIEEITIAFDGVSREGCLTLHEAAGWDGHCGIGPWIEEARAKDTDTKWQEVKDEWIAENGLGDIALSFIDAKGFRYYLPAYLIWSIKETVAGFPSDSNTDVVWYLGINFSTHRERFAFLNKQQSSAVAHFLLFLDQWEDEWLLENNFSVENDFPLEGKSDVQKALDAYWGQFL
jgi:hypothetical protein